MEIIRLNKSTMAEAVAEAVAALQRSGTVLYPTDTLYALGADALSDEAVDSVYAIKGRGENKPMHCIVADMEMAQRYGEIDGNAHVLAKNFMPGPLTLILKKKEGFNSGIARGISTIGIRIPRSDFCTEMVRAFGGPITTTSANLSGRDPEMSVEKVLEQLGNNAKRIDLAIDAGQLPESKPSTIVDVSAGEPVIVREGAIPTEDIWDVVRS